MQELRMAGMKIETVLSAKGSRVFTTSGEQAVGAAIATLAANDIGALIVVDAAGAPLGILSERDVIRALAQGGDVRTALVRDLMTSPITAGSPSDDVDAVLQTMTSRRFRHMPIVENGQLVGMCTLGDLVKEQLKQYRGALADLETQLMGSQ